jgi:NDP-sugar pyrophosphorylase family protein
MDPLIVVLAAGASSRMKHSKATGFEERLLLEAQIKPKSMIALGQNERPMMDYLLYNIRTAGYEEVTIVVAENDEHIRTYYGDASNQDRSFGLNISYALQKIPQGRPKPLGTADALMQAMNVRRDWRGKKFTVCNSDNIYSQRALGLLRETHHPCALIDYDREALQFMDERIEQFAVIHKDVEGYLVDIVEKPTTEQIQSATDSSGRVGISMNIFRFSYDLILPLLERLPLHPVRQEKEIPQAVKLLVQQNPRAVGTIPLSEYVPDLTTKSDIPLVREYLKREFPYLTLREQV